jgi:hypothetical protein
MGGDQDMQLKILGKPVGPGTVMLIKGERGQFRFHSVSWSQAGEMSLTFIGGPAGHESYRSFRPDRVKKVLRDIPTE